MFAIALIASVVFVANAGVLSPAYGPALAAPAYGPALAAPAYGPALAAPAYGPAIAAPIAAPAYASAAYAAPIAAPIAAPVVAKVAAPAILSTGHSQQSRSMDNLGNYAFNYNEQGLTGGSSRSESGNALGQVAGTYTLNAADGRQRVVKYVADAAGFRAAIATNEPGTAAQPAAATAVNGVAAPVPVHAPVVAAPVAVAAAPVVAKVAAPVAYGHGVAAPVAYGHGVAAPLYG